MGALGSRDAIIAVLAQLNRSSKIESCIRAVRRAVGDSGHEQRIIQTRYGQGYSVTVAVRRLPERHEPHNREMLQPVELGTPQDRVADHAASAGERKVVTILCCGLAPSDSAPLSLDMQHRRIQHLYNLAQHGIRQYDGYMQPITGASLSIIFGYPVAQEDHAQRAVLAALALYRQCAEQAPMPSYSEMLSEQEALLGVRMGVATPRSGR